MSAAEAAAAGRRIASQSRQEQGFPSHVEDVGVLTMLAAMLLAAPSRGGGRVAS